MEGGPINNINDVKGHTLLTTFITSNTVTPNVMILKHIMLVMPSVLQMVFFEGETFQRSPTGL